jgi:hypothetical protein
VGAHQGDGSLANPWDLETAFLQPASVLPGDTIYLRGGTYVNTWHTNARGDDCIFMSYLTGTAAAPIKVMSYPGEWARIDGGYIGSRVCMDTFDIHGAYTWYQNIEILDSNPTRNDSSTDTWTISSGKNAGINIAAGFPTANNPGVKVINCVIHDTSQGIDLWRGGAGDELHGNLIYYNGWEGADRAHGHGIYTQNDSNIQDLITDNFVFDQFEYGIHAYAGGGNIIRNYDVLRNISFNNGSIRGAGQNTNDIIIAGGTPNYKGNINVQENCCYTPNGTYGGGVTIGASWDGDTASPWGGYNLNLTLKNNHFIGGYAAENVYFWNTIQCSGNVVLTNPTNDLFTVLLCWGANQSPSNYSWDYNTYYAQAPYFKGFVSSGGTVQTSFSQWQGTTGLDAHSTCSTAAPTGSYVQIRKNLYDSGRANIAIYNWTGQPSVNVDLSSLSIANGSTYTIRDAQNYFAASPVTGTYTGALVPIFTAQANGSPLPIQPAIGNVTIPAKHTPEAFGAFVITFTSGPPTHQAPVVSAGAAQTIHLPVNSVSLAGTVSDDGIAPAGAITTTWSQVSGPGSVTFASVNALSTTATFSATGTYVLQLSANDTALTGTGNVQIIVAPAIPNAAPVVNAGPNQTISLPATSASLAGTVSDDGLPLGAAVTSTWSMLSGPGAVTFANANAPATTATFSTLGTYVLQLSAGDTALSAAATMQVVVQPHSALVMGLHLPFDEGSGTTTADTSGNNRNGTLAGGVTWISGKLGQALQFDGATGQVTAPNFTLTPQFTVAFWFKATNPPDGYHYMFSWGPVSTVNSINVWFYENGGPATTWLRTDIQDATGADQTNFSDVKDANLVDGQWHLYCATVASGVGLTVYVDGNSRITVPAVVVNSIVPNTQVFIGGRSDNNANRHFTGGIDDVRIYSQALAATDVTALYTGGPANVAPTAGASAAYPKVMIPNGLSLTGTISDDGLPNPPAACTAAWSLVSGPGTVTFGNAASASTTATFSTAGTYVLQLTASDSVLTATSNVTVTALAPGDFNGDGRVDGVDFLNWQSHYPTASGATCDHGDANGDGKVDGVDFLVWQSHYHG